MGQSYLLREIKIQIINNNNSTQVAQTLPFNKYKSIYLLTPIIVSFYPFHLILTLLAFNSPFRFLSLFFLQLFFSQCLLFTCFIYLLTVFFISCFGLFLSIVSEVIRRIIINMSALSLSLLLLILLVPFSLGATLKGQWHVQAIANRQVNLTLNITQFIFRETQVRYKMQWLGCRSILYQMDTQEDNMWIDVSSQWQQEVGICSDDQAQQMELLKIYVPGVLKFRIEKDKLIIMDPSYDPVFIMTRQAPEGYEEEYKDIQGQYLVQFASSPKEAHSMSVSFSQLSICKGAIFSYQIQAKYYLSISNKQLGECQDFELVSNLLKVVFYQKDNNKLLMYDNQIKLLGTALLKDNPTPAVMPNSLSTPPQVNPQIIAPALVMIANPTSQSGFSQGNYLVLLLFNRSMGRKKVEITQGKIIVQMCSQLIFEYQIFNSEEIEVSSSSAYDQSCSKGSQKIMIDTITTSKQYKVAQDGSIMFIDSQGRQIANLSMQ